MPVLINRVLWAVALAAILFAALGGCGDSKKSAPEGPAPTPPLGLALTLEVGTVEDSDEPIPLRLVLSNPGPDAIEFGIGGSSEHGHEGGYNFVVTDSGGADAWTWYNEAPILILNIVTLNPGQEMTFEGEWDKLDNDGNVLEPGTYHIIGRIAITSDPEGAGGALELTTETHDIEI